MTTQKSGKIHSAFWKTIVCISLSSFYFAMLAWPFGLSENGYMVSRAFLAGAIMFAISIPVWIITIKREFYSTKSEELQNVETEREEVKQIGQLAMSNNWLSPAEIKQVMFCQKADGMKFGQVAVKRNFLTLSQVKSLLNMQSGMKRGKAVEVIDS